MGCGVHAVFVLGQIVLGRDLGVQGLGLAKFIGILGRVRGAVVAFALTTEQVGHGIDGSRLNRDRRPVGLSGGLGQSGRRDQSDHQGREDWADQATSKDHGGVLMRRMEAERF
ncbi:hypothetical protein D3C80_1298140 [compost metagenome]